MSNVIDLPAAKKGLRVHNKAATVVEIELYDEIGESWWNPNSVSATQFKEAIDSLDKNVTEIHLRVNSPGGSVFDGMSMYELIKRERNNGRKVIAYVDGYAASIASVIIMACNEIVIGDGGMVMIHKPLTGVYGNATEMERLINILDKIEEQMITIYAKKTGKSRIELANELAAETWFTSDEAIKQGFADTKMDFKDTLALVASINDVHWFKNKPKVTSKNELVREQLLAFTNKTKSIVSSMSQKK